MKKYELTDETILVHGSTLHRIKLLRDVGIYKVGEYGGYIESEDNLSQDGDALVWSEAKVYDEAKVFGEAQVYGNAKVFGSAKVSGNAKVYGNAEVYSSAKVCGEAKVYDHAKVFGNAEVYDNAQVYDKAKVFGEAQVFGGAIVNGNVEICGNAVIHWLDDYIVFKNFWSSGRFFTYTRSNKMWKVGCFYGTSEELITKAYKDNPDKGWNYEQVVKYVESIEEHYHYKEKQEQ